MITELKFTTALIQARIVLEATDSEAHVRTDALTNGQALLFCLSPHRRHSDKPL